MSLPIIEKKIKGFSNLQAKYPNLLGYRSDKSVYIENNQRVVIEENGNITFTTKIKSVSELEKLIVDLLKNGIDLKKFETIFLKVEINEMLTGNNFKIMRIVTEGLTLRKVEYLAFVI